MARQMADGPLAQGVPPEIWAKREEDARYRVLVEAISDYAIFMLDTDGYVMSWNAGAQRFKGYRADEILGQHFSRFYTPEDQAAGAPELTLRMARDHGRLEREGWRVRKDGERFWAHVVIDAVRDGNGQMIGFAKVTRDISEWRATQEALDETRRELLQSQKMQSIGQLTGGIAHDFNNLVMAIMSSLEMLQKWVPPHPRAQGLLENAMRGAERGASLAQRLLAFARKQDLKIETIDVCKLANGLRELLEQSVGPTIPIEFDLAEALSPVRTDPNQLENALLNLVINARDAMPDGGRLMVSARTAVVGPQDGRALPGPYVVLAVQDTGVGMDEETLGRATEPFFTTKGVGKGTGLGLSMIQGLAEQSGGFLHASSTPSPAPGHGTRMEIWLPAAPAGEVEAVAEPAAPALDEPLDQHRILVVDDDVLVLMNTVAMLEEMGHIALQADSAKAALQLLDQDDCIDMVVTDQAMPQMTGLQLLEEIRARRTDVSVVIATGYAELPAERDRRLVRLAKPFRQAELAAAIKAAARGAAEKAKAQSTLH